jgi:hypothetical protein
MAIKTIEAKALLTADNKTAAAFRQIVAQLDAIGKATKAMNQSGVKEFTRTTKAVDQTARALKQIDDFKSMSRGLKDASIAFKAAQQQANAFGRALPDKPTRAMMREMDALNRAVAIARDGFKAQGNAVRDARRELEANGTAINRLTARQRELEAATAKANREQRQQHQLQLGMRPGGSVPNIRLPGDRAPVYGPWGAPRPHGGSVPSVPYRPAPAVPGGPWRESSIRHTPGGNAGTHAPVQIPATSIPLPAHALTLRPVQGSTGLAEAAGGVGVMAGITKVVGAGATVDSERSQMQQAGWTPAEILAAEAAAESQAAAAKMAKGSVMQIIREARPTFGGNLEQAISSTPDFLRFRNAMRQKNPNAGDGFLDKAVGDTIKAGEIMGYSATPDRLKGYADFMTRMAQVHGGALRPDEILNFAKRSKSAGSSMELEFLKSVFPTMLPEMGGDGLGTAAMTFRQAMVGGKMKKRVAENLAELGLIDTKGLIKTDDNDVMGVKQNALKDAALAARNPLEWIKQNLLPAMDAKGIRPEDRSTFMSSLFSDRNAEHFANLMVTQMDRLAKDRATVEKAPGLEGVDRILTDDAKIAFSGLRDAVTNASAALAGPFMDSLKGGADAASRFLNRATGVMVDNPDATRAGTAAVGGYLGWKGVGALAGRGLLPLAAGPAAGVAGGGWAAFEAWRYLDGALPKQMAGPVPEGLRQLQERQALRDRAASQADLHRAMFGSDMPARGSRGPAYPLGESTESLNALLNAALRQLEKPLDVTGKVQMEGQAKVQVDVRLSDDLKLAGLRSESSGFIRANTGVGLSEFTGREPGPFDGRRSLSYP